jgi:hypothetical protein
MRDAGKCACLRVSVAAGAWNMAPVLSVILIATPIHYQAGDDCDYVTVKYNRNGELKWVRQYNAPASGPDVANAIAAANGMVYVTGFSTGAHTSGDYMTRAYGAGGGYKWADRHDGPASEFDQGNAVGISPVTGHVYVTGGSTSADGGPDVATIKYAP